MTVAAPRFPRPRGGGAPLAFFCAVALLLRLWGIGWGLPHGDLRLRTLHPDEAIYVWSVSNLRPAQGDFDPDFYNHPNFLVYEIAAWIGIGHVLGVVDLRPDTSFYVAHPEATARIYLWVRLGMVTLSLGTMLLLYDAARTLYGRAAGLWAAACWAVLPLAVVDAHYVKTDTPQVFWIAAALSAAARFLAGADRRWLYAAAAAAALAASNKYSGAVSGVVPLAAAWLSRSRSDIRVGRDTFRAIGLAAGVFALVNPYVVASFFRDGARDVRFIFEATVGAEALRLRSEFEGKPPGWLSVWTDGFWYGVGPPFMFLIAASLAWALWRRSAADRLLVASWVAFYATVGGASMQFVRFWLPCAAFSCVMVGGMVTAIRSRRGRAMGVPGVAAALLYTTAYAAALNAIFARADTRQEASDWIRAHVRPGEPIGRLRHPEWSGAGRDFHLPPVVYRTPRERAAGAVNPYPRQWMNLDPEALRRPDRSRLLVVSSFETRNYKRLSDRYPRQAAFVRDLEAGVGYVERARFSRRPEILGIRLFPREHPPHDWIYAWPEIRIYERREGPSPAPSGASEER